MTAVASSALQPSLTQENTHKKKKKTIRQNSRILQTGSVGLFLPLIKRCDSVSSLVQTNRRLRYGLAQWSRVGQGGVCRGTKRTKTRSESGELKKTHRPQTCIAPAAGREEARFARGNYASPAVYAVPPSTSNAPRPQSRAGVALL